MLFLSSCIFPSELQLLAETDYEVYQSKPEKSRKSMGYCNTKFRKTNIKAGGGMKLTWYLLASASIYMKGKHWSWLKHENNITALLGETCWLMEIKKCAKLGEISSIYSRTWAKMLSYYSVNDKVSFLLFFSIKKLQEKANIGMRSWLTERLICTFSKCALPQHFPVKYQLSVA